MDTSQLAILVAGGFAAGVINTLAGGGSLITVGLLVFLGLPGTLANGTNRVGVLVQNVTSAWRFRAEGVPGFRQALPVLTPLLLGSLIGAYGISRVTPEFFQRLFGVVMLLLLIPMLRPARKRPSGEDAPSRPPWSPIFRAVVFFGLGVYGGAIQAGVGIFLLFALSRAGYDLIEANSVKVILIALLTLIAVPVFVWSGQIAWLPALALVAGFGAGGVAGVRLALLGGERLIRIVLTASVLALAGRMLEFF